MTESHPVRADVATWPAIKAEKKSASFELAVAILAVGLIAAVAFPVNAPGIGFPLIALAMGAAVALLAERDRINAEQWLFAGLGFALATIPAVRTGWILFLCILAAAGLASLAVVGGRNWGEVVGGLFSVLMRLPKAPGFLIRPIIKRADSTSLNRALPAIRGLMIGAGLLLLFGILFATADQAFARLARDSLVFLEWDWGLMPFRTFVFVATAMFTGAYALGFRSRSQSEKSQMVSARLGRTEWTIALTLLDLLFVAFVVVQFTVLFGGHDYVLRTEGLIYSEYARQGFFQLLVAAVLTLGVLAGAIRWAGRTSRADRVLLQVLLGVLCLLTLVVLASALRRLVLYEEAFGLTRARVTAHALIFWLGGVFVMAIAGLASWRGAWLAKTLVAYAAGALLIFALVNPDGLVASHNIDRFRKNGKIDANYLVTLSEDAVPALARAPESVRGCLLAPWRNHLKGADAWNELNLSRVQARRVLAEVGNSRPRLCPIFQDL